MINYFAGGWGEVCFLGPNGDEDFVCLAAGSLLEARLLFCSSLGGSRLITLAGSDTKRPGTE